MPLIQGPTPQPAPAPSIDLANPAALQAKLNDLQTRQNVLTAQRAVLVERTHSNNPAIAIPAEQNLLSVDMEQASVKAEIASIQAQLGPAKQLTKAPPSGDALGLIPPPPAAPTPPLIDPDAITAVFVLTSLAILIPLSIGISRRLWRRPTPPISALEDRISPRLDRLEQAVDTIAIEVERISEGQRFVTKVLTERTSSPQASANGSVQSEPQPYLALGAGPMEPIRQQERQPVKQSVTPH
jgi:hypothetical protein